MGRRSLSVEVFAGAPAAVREREPVSWVGERHDADGMAALTDASALLTPPRAPPNSRATP
jgi:hypothetical protein